jgi:hypothetical protein
MNNADTYLLTLTYDGTRVHTAVHTAAACTKFSMCPFGDQKGAY